MGNRAKKKAQKKKKREERLRKEKHERRAQPQVAEDATQGKDNREYAPRSAYVAPGRDDEGDEDEDWDEDDDVFPDDDVYWDWHDEPGWDDDPCDEAFCMTSTNWIDTERILRHAARIPPEKRTTDLETAYEFSRQRLDEFGSLGSIPLPADPVERGQELVFRAMQADSPSHALRLAEEALRADPECLDAMAIVAQQKHESWLERAAEFERIVATGERRLGGPAFLEAHKGEFWNRVETRPYMRVREQLAHLLAFADRLPEALAHYEALLELDPRDHLHLRVLLLSRYLELGRLDDAKRIMARFPHGRAAYLWARVLGHFLAGNLPAASLAHRRALDASARLETAIRDRLEPEPRENDPLGELDKMDVVESTLIIAWDRHPEALGWLLDGGWAFSDREVDAHVDSFKPPVSKLFAIEEPDEYDWLDYPATHGFTEAHVPELVRMATDQALQENEEYSICFGAVHAWRALAQLRAQAAIAPLIEAFTADLDDYSNNDFSRIFELLGPEAIPGLRALLVERYDVGLRTAAVQALWRIGTSHTDAAGRCIEVLLEQLRRYRENHRMLNDRLVEGLARLRSQEAFPVMKEAIANGYLTDDRSLDEFLDSTSCGQDGRGPGSAGFQPAQAEH